MNELTLRDWRLEPAGKFAGSDCCFAMNGEETGACPNQVVYVLRFKPNPAIMTLLCEQHATVSAKAGAEQPRD